MTTEKEIQQFMKKNLFFCKKLNAKISPASCNLNQQKKYTIQHPFHKRQGFEDEYCKNCKQGKKHRTYIKKNTKRVLRTKVCQLYKVLPKKCKNRKLKGVMTESPQNPAATFNRKVNCSPECANFASYKYTRILIKRMKEKEAIADK